MVCPFCERLANRELIAENPLAVAFFDAYPLTAGHSLLVPRRHEPDFFALATEEQEAVWSLVTDVRRNIEAAHTPAGYNIGINIGYAAGQTVAHAHLHLIPRYRGDVADPRGGVRWVIPSRAVYWEEH